MKLRSPRTQSAFTVVELLVSLSAALILLGAVFVILETSVTSWRRVSGDQGASGEILKAESWIRRDLFATSFLALQSADGPVTLVGKDGDALWFLSAIDPNTNEFIRNDDGSPRWQRNILYYSVIPSGLNVSFSGIQEEGYEVSHPHKVLVRKVIDSGPPTDPLVPSSQETLIADITPYLERPNLFTFSSGDSESVSVVARNLLSFRVNRDIDLSGISVSLQTANIEEAKKTFPLGTRSLNNPQFLMERRFMNYPENRLDLEPSTP